MFFSRDFSVRKDVCLSISQAVQDEIYISYLKLKNDREYMSQRSALDRLKKKLNHIRCMIEGYDDRVLESS